MHLAGLSLRNLTRRPLRSALTAAGVALATACLVAIVGVSHSMERGWITALLERDTHVLASRAGTAEALAGVLPVELGERIARVEGVRSVCPELVEMVAMDARGTMFVAGWAPGGRLWGTLRMVEGRLPRPQETHAVVMGRTAADLLAVRPGATWTFRGRDFTVVGVFHQDGALNNSTVVLPLAALQELTGMQGRATLFSVQVDRPDDPEWMKGVLARLAAVAPELEFRPSGQAGQNSELLRLLRGIAWGISAIAVAMGCLVVLNTLLMSVMERTHEIGVLGALGWPGGRVLAMLLLEGAVLSAAGALAGAGLGLATLHALSAGPRLRGLIDANLPASILLLTAGGMALLGTLAGLYPAWRALRLNTLEAVRCE